MPKRTRKSSSRKKADDPVSQTECEPSTILVPNQSAELPPQALPSQSVERVEVLPPDLPSSPLWMYPYQVAWINDDSRLKIADKARRIGFSFAAGFAGVLDCLERKQNFIVLSRGERQSKEFISESVAPHVRAAGVIAD